MNTKRFLITLLILITALCLLGCAKSVEVAPAAAPTAVPTATPTAAPTATPAPDENGAVSTEAKPAVESGYNGVTFSAVDLTGRKITETYIRDSKVTVVNFWATWCPPCVREIPEFSEVAAAYATKGCVFLGVQLDEDAEAANQLWEKHGVTYPSVLPDGDLMGLASQMSAIPVTILFDSEGQPIGEPHVGSMSKDELTDLIDGALSEQ